MTPNGRHAGRPPVPARGDTERVYDRAVPSRFGTASDFDRATFTMLVRWDDTGESVRVDVDHLGHVPPGAES